MIDYSFSELLQMWNINHADIRPDLEIPGSPERSKYRTVIESNDKVLYVLEAVENHQYPRKRYLAETLSELDTWGSNQKSMIWPI